MEPPSRSPKKSLALAITIALVVAFGLPGVRHVLPKGLAAKDSFPISTFAMFSNPRPPEHRMTWVRALDRDGKSVGHVPSGAFHPGGMNQAMAYLREARRDEGRRVRICNEIARKLVERRYRSRVKQIEIVDAYYRPEKVFGPARDERPERERVLVTCQVRS
jgi:hypothetical protein